MLKLAIAAAAGITISAILCGMMALRSNSSFQSRNHNSVYGLYPPRSKSNTQSGPSFSLNSGSGGYLPPKAESENNDSAVDLTTPLFRIFILPTSTTPSPPESSATTTTTTTTTTAPPGSTTTPPSSTSPITTTISSTVSTSPTTVSTTTSTTTTTTPVPVTTTPTSTPSTTKEVIRKEEAVAEATTAASVAAIPSPTPYAYPGNPSPAFKIDQLWSTLVPPSVGNSQNEVPQIQNTKLLSPSAAASGVGGTLSSNGIYLPPPPEKEYLPPAP